MSFVSQENLDYLRDSSRRMNQAIEEEAELQAEARVLYLLKLLIGIIVFNGKLEPVEEDDADKAQELLELLEKVVLLAKRDPVTQTFQSLGLLGGDILLMKRNSFLVGVSGRVKTLLKSYIRNPFGLLKFHGELKRLISKMIEIINETTDMDLTQHIDVLKQTDEFVKVIYALQTSIKVPSFLPWEAQCLLGLSYPILTVEETDTEDTDVASKRTIIPETPEGPHLKKVKK